MSCLDYVALQATSDVNYGCQARNRPRDGQNAPFGAASTAMSGRAENLRYAGLSRLVLRVRQWLAAADPRPHAREELGHTALRFVASVALTCTGRVAGWVPGRVWGAELRTLSMLQVRGVTPAVQVAG